jgi:hypothetical protein
MAFRISPNGVRVHRCRRTVSTVLEARRHVCGEPGYMARKNRHTRRQRGALDADLREAMCNVVSSVTRG